MSFFLLEVSVLKAHPHNLANFTRRESSKSSAWKRVESQMCLESHETHMVDGSECGFWARTLVPTGLHRQANVSSGQENESADRKRVRCSRVFCCWSIRKALLWQRFHSQLLSVGGLIDENSSMKSITAQTCMYLLTGASAKTKDVKLCFLSREYLGKEALTRLTLSRFMKFTWRRAASWQGRNVARAFADIAN